MNDDFDATVPRGTLDRIKNAPGLGSVVSTPRGDGVIIDEIEVGGRRRLRIVPYNDPTGEPIDIDATDSVGAPQIEKSDPKKLDKAKLQSQIDALEVRIKDAKKDREVGRTSIPERDVRYAIRIDHLKTAKRVLERLLEEV